MRWIISERPKYIPKFDGISAITSTVLFNRGIDTKEKAEKYINTSSEYFTDPYAIPDYEKGLEIVKKAIVNKDKICIYGDYDVDGVMSTTILFKALENLNADVDFYVPHRVYDGYGLNSAAIEKIHSTGCKLLITCDNGISSLDDVALAKKLGMKVIVLDHHEPVVDGQKQILPPADAVIDCKRNDSPFPFRDMCAAGLCYRFTDSLYKYMGLKFGLKRELITLAGIATVCDIVDLREDNRIIVKNALYLLNNSITNIGLKYLVDMSVQKGRQITPYTIGFNIGPCINAIGRLEAASEAVELFTTHNNETAKNYASKLVLKNKERQQITDKAAAALEDQVDISLPVQVLYDPDIHESVAGIIASRIKEKFYRPTLVITNSENGCKGSGRSVEEYDLHKGLSKAGELFTKFGGHKMAVGFSLPYENITPLKKALNDDCEIKPETMIPSVKPECVLTLDDFDLDTAYELRLLEPFGKGNPKPSFCTLSAKLVSIHMVGKDKNIAQMTFLKESGKTVRAVYFDCLENLSEILEKNGCEQNISLLSCGTTVDVDIKTDIAYYIEVNSFNNNDSLQLNIIDMR